MSFDWKRTLATVAPALATALGGPMAGVAVRIAAEKLGMDPNATSESDLATAVASGDPSILLKLREAEADLKIEMRRLDIDLQRINVDDRKSARDLAAIKGLAPQMILGTVYTGGFIWLLVSLFTGDVTIEPEQKEIANVLLGILGAGQAQVLNFFFGSSTGSKQKDAAAALAK
jgi:hypothetical protein